MGDDITIGVTEIVNNIEVTAQPNDQIVDISVIDNTDEVTLNITPTVIEINVNKGSSYAKWGTILGTLSDQTDLQDALDLKADLVDGKVPSSQLPSYVDDVIEVANYAALPVTGEIGKIYITLDDNHIFRWTGSIYVEITDNTAVWGAITGTLSSQTDLQSALNAKVPYTGATANVNLGEYGIKGGYLALDTTPTSTPTGIGTIYWDSANRTAALIDGDGDTMLQIGQEQRILVHNNTGSTLTDGQIVYVTGSTGELPSVSLANASSETTSGATIGMITESIANGADGFVTTSGIVHGLNTLAFNEGDLLWLGTTAGTFTATKPISPNHLVLIGYVIKKAGGNGSILVKIQNTQELEESSDVLFSGLANNDLLVYETASALWKNKSLATVLGYTPANDTNVVHKTGNESIAGWKTFTGGITLWDNSSNNLLDFFISGTEVGSISVGSSFFQFKALNSNGYLFQNNSGSNSLTISNSGNGTFLGSVTATSIIKTGGTSSQFLKADGSVDSTSYQPLLTNPITGTGTTNYLSKFTGSTTLGNSLIYDNGTNIGIGTTSPSSKLHILSYNNNSTLSTSNSASLIIHNTYGGSSATGGALFFKSDVGTYNTFAGIGGDLSGSTASGSYGHLIFGTKNTATDTQLSERMRITSGGNVGIGTTLPSEKLEVNGNILSNDGSSGGKILFGSSLGAYISGNSTTGQLGFSASIGSPTMVINSSAKVGIGTTSPLTTLTVSGNLSLFTTNQIRLYNSAKNNWTQVDSPLLSGDTEVDFRVLTKTGTFYINASGKVGIGTTSPNSKLHVLGKGIFDIGSSSGDVLVVDKLSGGNIAFNINGVYSGQIGAVGSGDLYIASKSTYPAIVVKDGGNVGIGTAAPTSKLHVVGLPEYATNGLALAGGLTVGAFYHTAGVLKVVI